MLKLMSYFPLDGLWLLIGLAGQMAFFLGYLFVRGTGRRFPSITWRIIGLLGAGGVMIYAFNQVDPVLLTGQIMLAILIAAQRPGNSHNPDEPGPVVSGSDRSLL